jgi:hypothetical protein
LRRGPLCRGAASLCRYRSGTAGRRLFPLRYSLSSGNVNTRALSSGNVNTHTLCGRRSRFGCRHGAKALRHSVKALRLCRTQLSFVPLTLFRYLSGTAVPPCGRQLFLLRYSGGGKVSTRALHGRRSRFGCRHSVKVFRLCRTQLSLDLDLGPPER